MWTDEYNYEEKALWTDSSYFGGFLTYASLLVGNADGPFAVETMINSKQGESIIHQMKGTFLYSSYADEKTFELWAERGIEKAVFHEEDSELLYSAFAPSYAMAETNDDVYPVVIVFHGGGRNLLDAEFYGFTDICAQEGFIVVCPETEDYDHAADHVVRILDEIEGKGYPIDRSRIYLAGHSNGGRCSMNAAVTIPEQIAAIAPMGALRRFDEEYVSAGLKNHETLDVPIYSIVGQFDRDHLPVIKDENNGIEYSFSSYGLIENLNQWLQKNGCATQLSVESCREAMESGTDEVSAFLGLYGNVNHVDMVDDAKHYVADYLDNDGVIMVRVEGVSNLPHWLSGSYGERAWEFLRHFSRDVDGTLLYTE